MAIELVDLVLRFASAGILLLFALLLLRDRRDLGAVVGIAIIACCGAFLLTSSNPFYREGLIDLILRQIAALTPVVLCLAIFGQIKLPRDWYVPAAIAVYVGVGIMRAIVGLESDIAAFLGLAHGLIAVGLLLGSGARIALQKDRRNNLRTQFAVVSIVFGSIVAYVDPIGHAFDIPLMLELLASAATFSFALSVAFSMLALPSWRFAETHTVASVIEPHDHAVAFTVASDVAGGQEDDRRKTGGRA
jgi:hypothetical protein